MSGAATYISSMGAYIDLDLKRHAQLHHVVQRDVPRLAVGVRQHLQGAVHAAHLGFRVQGR